MIGSFSGKVLMRFAACRLVHRLSGCGAQPRTWPSGHPVRGERRWEPNRMVGARGMPELSTSGGPSAPGFASAAASAGRGQKRRTGVSILKLSVAIRNTTAPSSLF